MIPSLLTNFARAVATFLVVTFATFALMYSNAAGIARATLGLNVTPEQVERKIVTLGLDRPLPIQYFDWLGGAFTGDLGRSFYTSEQVTTALATRVPVTLTLVVVTLVLTAVISVVLGVTAAVKGGWIDRVLQFVSVFATAVPSFIIAIALVFFFAVALRLLPATGYIPINRGVDLWLLSITLPVLALLINAVAGAAQQFRTAVLDTLGRDFVRTLRSRGVPERQIIFRNVLKNAAAPGFTALSLQTFSLLGGAVFIETVFALGGMGQLANSSAQIQDIPMVMGCVLVTIIIVLVVNFTSDALVMVLNPKARNR